MRSFVKKQKGITLIALVVTIIVLIILAGVSISMVIGDNGIITQAQRAARDTANATVASEEQMNTLAEELNRYLTEDEKTSGIFSKIVTSRNYGDYVDYPIDLNGDGNTTNDWKIFYNNGTNIFMIAADYVPNTSSYLDNAATGMVTADTYGLYWSEAPSTTQTVNPSVLTLFNQSWTDYSTNPSGKAASILLNTNNWDGFVNSSYADYAIGGATLEMWVESYNAKGYTPLYTNTNDRGYYIGLNEGTTNYWQFITEETEGITVSGYNDTLYFPHQEEVDNCLRYWLVSPGADYTQNLMGVNYNGNISSAGYVDVNIGVRPVVSLKSGVTATKSSNDIWTLSAN